LLQLDAAKAQLRLDAGHNSNHQQLLQQQQQQQQQVNSRHVVYDVEQLSSPDHIYSSFDTDEYNTDRVSERESEPVKRYLKMIALFISLKSF